MIPRRSFLTGMGAIIASPAIVRASSLMGMPRQTRWFGTAEEAAAWIKRSMDAELQRLLAFSGPVPWNDAPFRKITYNMRID